MHQLVVFISGSGSNLQAIIDHASLLNLEITLVVSNRKKAYGLTRAEKAGIPTLYFPRHPYNIAHKSREQYDTDLAQMILPHAPDLIVLAGWMHIFTPSFLDHFPQSVINLHPALPGQFPGAHAIEEAFAAYQAGTITKSGCMIHYVIPELDAGPVLVYKELLFTPQETIAQYTARLHQAEHQILLKAIETHFQN